MLLLKDAIKQRLENLMYDKNIKSKYELACEAGLNPSLITDFFNDRTKYPKIDTLFLICEGMNITLCDFFNDSLFEIENIVIEKDSK